MSFFENFTNRLCNAVASVLYAATGLFLITFGAVTCFTPRGFKDGMDLIVGGVRVLGNAWDHLTRVVSGEAPDNIFENPLLKK
jgi:hypothetical protein